MQLSQEQIADIFADVKPALVESLKKELLVSIEWTAKNTISTLVAEELKTWAQENIVPAIRDRLAESQEGILAAVVPAAESIATDLGKALAVTLAEKLGEKYARQKLFKAMFGDGY